MAACEVAESVKAARKSGVVVEHLKAGCALLQPVRRLLEAEPREEGEEWMG